MTSYRADKIQAQNLLKFDFNIKFDLEGQGRPPGSLIKVFCTFGQHLVFLVWTGHESCKYKEETIHRTNYHLLYLIVKKTVLW